MSQKNQTVKKNHRQCRETPSERGIPSEKDETSVIWFKFSFEEQAKKEEE